MQSDLKNICSTSYTNLVIVGGTLIIKNIQNQTIFTLVINSVESFKSCLEFLQHKSFAPQTTNNNSDVPNASLLNPAVAIVHKFSSSKHSRKLISIEQAPKDESIYHSVCRRVTSFFV